MAASRCWVGGELPGEHDADECGAHEWNRTIDLLLTKEVLYRLSYVSGNFFSTAVERIRWWSKWLNGAGEGNRTLVISLEN
jgi:hypothetical protein